MAPCSTASAPCCRPRTATASCSAAPTTPSIRSTASFPPCHQDGFVSVTFDNGNVKQFYQIPVARFRDPTELDRVAGNAFVETPSSGSAVLSQSGSSGAGDYVSAAIEGSNVDIAEEFSKLIVAQRTYSANARLITAADELLQETINIRR